MADTIARYHRLIGDKTWFLTGTDEHGQKVEKEAEKNRVDPEEFVDKIAAEDKKEWASLNISYDRFIRTTDPDHKKFAQEAYLRAKKNGDIYLGKYEGLYCEGCEAFLAESDLKSGVCIFHPNKKPLKIVEKNYFFRLSKYQDWLEKYLEENPDFVQPEAKRKEVLSFVKSGLTDFSVSRQGVKWGIPVPDDLRQTIYVWFDALLNYLTYGLEEKCWPANVHVLGKDNQRFHAVYWPAILKSLGYELPKTILVHDFFSLNGQKISKSLGNIIRPSELVKKYTTDGVRYYLLRFGPLNNDVDITFEKVAESYNADLANGLGNLIARVAKLAEKSNFEFRPTSEEILKNVGQELEKYQVDKAIENLWKYISDTDKHINLNEPWTKKGNELKEILNYLIKQIRAISYNLQPFLPETAEKIQKQFAGPKIKSEAPLFPRI